MLCNFQIICVFFLNFHSVYVGETHFLSFWLFLITFRCLEMVARKTFNSNASLFWVCVGSPSKNASRRTKEGPLEKTHCIHFSGQKMIEKKEFRSLNYKVFYTLRVNQVLIRVDNKQYMHYILLWDSFMTQNKFIIHKLIICYAHVKRRTYSKYNYTEKTNLSLTMTAKKTQLSQMKFQKIFYSQYLHEQRFISTNCYYRIFYLLLSVVFRSDELPLKFCIRHAAQRKSKYFHINKLLNNFIRLISFQRFFHLIINISIRLRNIDHCLFMKTKLLKNYLKYVSAQQRLRKRRWWQKNS